MASVTADEIEQYRGFVLQQLQRISAILPDTPLWHYTNGNATINIIKTASLWSTQVSCVNDHTELLYATRLFRNALEKYYRTQTLSADEQHLYKRIQDRLHEENAAAFWFVTCFSEAEDDLSQWRAYAEGEGGYSIGFNAKKLETVASPDHVYIAKVSYDMPTHLAIADATAAATFHYFRLGLTGKGRNLQQWADDFLTAWGDAVTYLGPVVKDPAFAPEREWRLLRGLRDPDLPNIKYTQKRTLMARHLPLNLTVKNTDNKSVLPIDKIVVGPSRNNHVSLISLGTLLATSGYPNTEVTLSKVPYQVA